LPYLRLMLRLRSLPPVAPGTAPAAVAEAFEAQPETIALPLIINR
jgi:hypothetical protein